MDSRVTFLLKIPQLDLGFRGLCFDFGKDGAHFPYVSRLFLTQTVLAKLSLMLYSLTSQKADTSLICLFVWRNPHQAL